MLKLTKYVAINHLKWIDYARYTIKWIIMVIGWICCEIFALYE